MSDNEQTYSGRIFITVAFNNLRVVRDAHDGAVLSEVVGGKILDDLRRAVAALGDTHGATYAFEADLRVLDVTSSSDERALEPL